MDKEVRDKWVKALRSGDYRQRRYQLQDADGSNCCLGVLCRTQEVPSGVDDIGDVYFDGEAEKLSSTLLLRFGLRYSEARHLMNMNDNERKTFPEIADWIEANL